MILFLWPHCSCRNGLVTSNMAPAHPHATSVAVYQALFRLERYFHIFYFICLTVSIFLSFSTWARGTNGNQFPLRRNFKIINILSCPSVISFYFPPLEVVLSFHCRFLFILVCSLSICLRFDFPCPLCYAFLLMREYIIYVNLVKSSFRFNEWSESTAEDQRRHKQGKNQTQRRNQKT